jgi:hypothetical protein
MGAKFWFYSVSSWLPEPGTVLDKVCDKVLLVPFGVLILKYQICQASYTIIAIIYTVKWNDYTIWSLQGSNIMYTCVNLFVHFKGSFKLLMTVRIHLVVYFDCQILFDPDFLNSIFWRVSPAIFDLLSCSAVSVVCSSLVFNRQQAKVYIMVIWYDIVSSLVVSLFRKKMDSLTVRSFTHETTWW